MKILYFASLKETTKTSGEEIAISSDMTAGELRQLLVEKYGDHYFPSNILCAVNQVMANDSTLLTNSDEVAFYPPVTGG